MFPDLLKTVERISQVQVSSDRLLLLNPLQTYIQAKLDVQQPINLNFICTHNSRRSHLAQIWAQTLAWYFKIPQVFCFSGGTEATAMFPKIAETLEYQGFNIQQLLEAPNPVYAVKFDAVAHPVICFSKEFGNPFNPASGFAAILTCDHASETCPFVPGAEARFPITFQDPKAFDQSPLQTEKYRERSLEIAGELFQVFSNLKTKNQ
ncbi:MAG: protein-tyrosine-phosphatase [Bacteroidetes bacterium]|nr:protein-tyrosine-phosphatase [Bacteroidota bacterium]